MERIYGMRNRENKSINKLTKVIYFDESSVTDYIQIIEGGQLIKTTELLSGDTDSGEAKVSAEASIGISSLFKNLIGLGGKSSNGIKFRNIFLKSEELIKNNIAEYNSD